MPVINKGTSFSNGEQLTATKLNNSLDLASFDTSAVDNDSTFVNSSGQIVVRDEGITTPKIAPGAVNFSKLTDVIDDDTMATASATTLATSESIKAYVNSSQARFVPLSGGTTALTKTNETGSVTYNLNDFTSDALDFDSSNISGLVVEAFVHAKRSPATNTTSKENIIRASLPNGSDTVIVRAVSQFVTSIGFNNNAFSGQLSNTTTTIPINSGQSSFTLTFEIENQGPTTFAQTIIKGAMLN